MMRIMRLTPDILFESDHLRKDLAQKTVRGGVTTMSAQVLQFLLHTGSTMILARLLSPSDYGLLAMVTVITGFLEMFKDAGLNMATIQQEKITRDQISTLFWINVIISTGLGLLILAGAPLVGLFYKRPELVPVTAFLSINFALGGLTLQHNALLQRHMMFPAQRTILIGSMIIGIIVSIILAYYGFRYWALVWGTLATSLVRIALTWFYCNWIPSRMKKGTGVRKMLKFGGYITGFNFINYFARNGDNLLIGKFIGAEPLGLYAKAYSLFMLPISLIRGPLSSVMLPALSSLQNQSEKYARYYYRFVNILATLVVPLAIYCFIEADFIIKIILGNKWLGAIPVFRILALCGLFQAVSTTWGVVLISSGYAKRYFYLGVINTVLTIISFIIGLRWGILGVATAYTIYNYLSLYLILYFSFKNTGINIKEFFMSFRIPMLHSLIALSIWLIIRHILLGNTNLGHIVSSIAFMLVIIVLSLLRPSIFELIRFLFKTRLGQTRQWVQIPE